MAKLKHAEVDPKHEQSPVDTSAAGPPDKPAELSHVPAPDAAVVSSSIPSFAAASELLSAPYSCLVLNTHRRHVSLPPMFLSKKRTGLRLELQNGLLKFSQT